MTRDREGQILLVFPPVWDTSAPYLSLPSLAAHARSTGHETRLLDANLLYWNHFKRDAEIASLWHRCRVSTQRPPLPAPQESSELLLSNTMISSLGRMSLPEFRTYIDHLGRKSQAFRLLVNMVGGTPSNHLRPGNGSRLETAGHYQDYYYPGHSLSSYAEDSRALLPVLSDRAENHFIAFFEDMIAALDDISSLRLAGISIAGLSQVVAAFTLAGCLRQSCPGLKIVMGGPWCTQVRNLLHGVPGLFDLVDGIVVFEGEKPLGDLLINSRLPRLASSPNLYFRSNRSVHEPDTFCDHVLSGLPTPDFSGLPLSEYDEHGSLPLIASRGCYWAKCTFCSYPSLEPVYKVRGVPRVVEDIAILRDRYGCIHVPFADPILSPHFMRTLAAALRDSESPVTWSGFARLEDALHVEDFADLFRGGCRAVFWGLESGNQRVLDLIQKGIRLDHAAELLKHSAAAGIHNRALMMYGHPTETFAEVMDSVRFVEENLEYIHSLTWSSYTLETGTPVSATPVAFGLQESDAPTRDLAIRWEQPSRFSAPDMDRLNRHLTAINDEIIRRNATGGLR